MRKAYLICGLALMACPSAWTAAQLKSSARPAPTVPLTRMERGAEALLRARTISADPAPVPMSLPKEPAVQVPAGGPARSMVTVDAFREAKGSATQLSGTGVVASSLGHIYVPYFVVRKADALIVTFSNGERIPARLLGGDHESQLAVLKVSYIPEGISVPEMTSRTSEQAGRPVALLLPDGRQVRQLKGAIVGEKPRIGPLRNVLEVTIASGVEVQGGILSDAKGALVGLALATAESEQPGKQSVLVLPASRMEAAVGRMVRGEAGTEAPQPVNLTVI